MKFGFIKKNRKQEDVEYDNFDDYRCSRDVEISLDKFLNEYDKLSDNIEYTIKNEYGYTYCLSYNTCHGDNKCEIIYFESYDAKLWQMKIQVKEFLRLKVRYIEKYYNTIDASLDLKEGCILILRVVCDKKDRKDMVQALERIHGEFENRFILLEKEVRDVIRDFKI